MKTPNGQMEQREHDLLARFETYDRGDLNEVGRVFMHLRRSLEAIVFDVTSGLIEDHEVPPEIMLRWVASTLAGENNPAIEPTLDWVGRSCWLACEYLRRAMAACATDAAAQLGLGTTAAAGMLELFSTDVYEHDDDSRAQVQFRSWVEKQVAARVVHITDATSNTTGE